MYMAAFNFSSLSRTKPDLNILLTIKIIRQKRQKSFNVDRFFMFVPINAINQKTKEPLSIKGSRSLIYGDLSRARTCDPHPVKMVLSQLSYEIAPYQRQIV